MTEITPALGLPAYFLGRRIAGQRKRMPVAYLYNGVRLPALPEWDREKYPYAYILRTGLSTVNTSLYIVDTPLNATVTSTNVLNGVNSNGLPTKYRACNYNEESEQWGSFVIELSTVFKHAYIPLWANTDMEAYYSRDGVYEPTGEIGIAASEPVPVYE